ncbi:PEP-CTERM sorting domain-containing protein [Cerasicoccus arenae]|uniref:Ice-binding protein C-terminal domain-containing protein n=1 Tax=Cerasicoccus arenae TaxID=424488 RepID=A0A8J3GFY7_9BACT|nr:PEP-CTERM sorting domain-containing protein [Cerasicoccus arenae]MBK1857880.1 PEP-CTERM sorting domain-containing protein [Cerasicoccus arenae]GHC09426.1 hypothetical protein GCM10007047_28310 [Cerasicoccus arenae]
MKLQTFLTTAALLTGLYASSAQGALLINFTESGGDTTVTFSGSFNLNATLGFDRSLPSGNYLAPNFTAAGYISIPGANKDNYLLNTQPLTFGGSGSPIVGIWSSVTGNNFGLQYVPSIAVPAGYISGDPFNGSAVAVGRDFASLRLTPGTTVVNTFSNGPISDTVTINVTGAAVIPEPSTYIAGAGLIGLAAFVFVRARRKKVAATK